MTTSTPGTPFKPWLQTPIARSALPDGYHFGAAIENNGCRGRWIVRDSDEMAVVAELNEHAPAPTADDIDKAILMEAERPEGSVACVAAQSGEVYFVEPPKLEDVASALTALGASFNIEVLSYDPESGEVLARVGEDGDAYTASLAAFLHDLGDLAAQVHGD